MIKKTYYIILILILFCLSCGNKQTPIKEQKTEVTENEVDIIFLESFGTGNNSAKAYLKNYHLVINIDEKLVFNMFRVGAYSECFIKEYGKNEIKRFFQIYDDYIFYLLRNKKTRKMDTALSNYYRTFIRADEEIIYKNEFNHDNETFEHLLSEKFWNIPEVRKPLYNKYEPPNDIKKLEELVNELEIFENYEINSDYHNNILKKLLMLTQVNLVMCSYPIDYNTWNIIEYLSSNENIIELQGTNEIYKLKELKDKRNKWQKNNIEFLQTKLKTIGQEINEPNIFYFLTCHDYKLFRFEVNIIDGKIKLQKEYINKHFMQEDPVWFFRKDPSY